ncbi:hypothetical protein F4703DRAFT_1862316 [Phycomyces blakesleeanus]
MIPEITAIEPETHAFSVLKSDSSQLDIQSIQPDNSKHIQSPVDTDTVRKQYENMSYDEMSQRMAESYKELSEMLGNRWSNPLSDITDTPSVTDDGEDELEEKEFTEADKKTKATKDFSRTVSSGDLTKVLALLQDENTRSLIDIDARDKDGTTPLIYAACFGKTEIAQALLTAGAKVDIQDSIGWSALMWATTNSHEALVKVLLAHGASSQQKTAKGRTAFDFVNTENHKIADILNTNPRDSMSSTSSAMGRTVYSSSSASSNAGDNDFYYYSTAEGVDNFLAEESDRRQHLMETAMALAGGTGDDDDEGDDGDEDYNYGDNDDDDNGDDIYNTFDWDSCMPHQMFVFNADHLNYILDTVITCIEVPLQSDQTSGEPASREKRQEMCVPANVVFLSARFAHYYSSSELLHNVLSGALARMSKYTKAHSCDLSVLAFWITNFSQLLYYLKKDAGLVAETADYQLALSELISETYTLIVNASCRRMTKLLESAMLDYEEIPGMEDIDFTDDWHRFFRRNPRRSAIMPDNGAMAMRRHSSLPAISSALEQTSPQSVTNILSTTFQVLQFYEVHPTIIIQVLCQFLHSMSCELFNRILTSKKRLSRSKALQVRMNLSHVEDWINHQRLPASLMSYLNPITQLLQLLQCVSQLDEPTLFIETVTKFDALNALQIKRCVMNYRYEVNEPRLPENIEHYVCQLAEDTVRFRQARQKGPDGRQRGSSMSRAQSVSIQRKRSRRESVSQFVGSLISSVNITASASLPPSIPTETAAAATAAATATATASPLPAAKEEASDDEDKQIKETKDSRFMLPFSVPTTAHMVHISGWAPEDSRREKIVVPVIPEEWMNTLDKGDQEN